MTTSVGRIATGCSHAQRSPLCGGQGARALPRHGGAVTHVAALRVVGADGVRPTSGAADGVGSVGALTLSIALPIVVLMGAIGLLWRAVASKVLPPAPTVARQRAVLYTEAMAVMY